MCLVDTEKYLDIACLNSEPLLSREECLTSLKIFSIAMRTLPLTSKGFSLLASFTTSYQPNSRCSKESIDSQIFIITQEIRIILNNIFIELSLQLFLEYLYFSFFAFLSGFSLLTKSYSIKDIKYLLPTIRFTKLFPFSGLK